MRRLRGEDGFTLVELIVVVSIISILAAITIPSFLNARDRSFRAVVLADLRHAAGVMAAFEVAEGRYPLDGEVTLVTSPAVTLSIALPAALADADEYCVEGRHVNLGPGPAATYDTRAGGLVVGAAC